MIHSDNPLSFALRNLFNSLSVAIPACSGKGIPFTPELRQDLFDKLEEARELLRHDLGLPPTADDYEISERLKREWRVY